MIYNKYEKPKYDETMGLFRTVMHVEMEINRCRFIIANWEADLRYCTNEDLLTSPYHSNKYFNDVLDRINHYKTQIGILEEFLKSPVLGEAPQVDDNEEVIWMEVE